MAWQKLTVAKQSGGALMVVMGPDASAVTVSGFTPSESAVLQSIQNAINLFADKLSVVVKEWIGVINAANYPVNNDGTVPPQFARHIAAEAVWLWLKDYPQYKAIQTKAREDAAKDAQRIYEKIAMRTYGAIESPSGTDTTTGNWNSNNKLVMRTFPTPAPSLQFQMTVPNEPPYSNPNAPSDMVPTNSPGVPIAPLNVTATGQNGQVLLTWDPALNAAGYSIYRGLMPGGELATPIVSNLAVTEYVDPGLQNGTVYYYRIASTNGALISPLSNETSATPQAPPP